MKTKPGEPLWWLRIKICFNILLTRLLRILFEITVLIVWVIFLIPMLLNQKFFKKRVMFFFKELSDFAKPSRNG